MVDAKVSRHGARRFPMACFSLILLLGCAVLPATARADIITITSGEIIFDSLQRVTAVNLSGGGLTIQSRIDAVSAPGAGYSYTTATIFCGCDGVGRATFAGLTVSGFAGGGSFDGTTLAGSITFYGNFDSSLNQPPFPFTLRYVGTGVLSVTSTRTTFTVTPVPEPTTLLLFGTGIGAIAARYARKRAQAKNSARAR